MTSSLPGQAEAAVEGGARLKLSVPVTHAELQAPGEQLLEAALSQWQVSRFPGLCLAQSAVCSLLMGEDRRPLTGTAACSVLLRAAWHPLL